MMIKGKQFTPLLILTGALTLLGTTALAQPSRMSLSSADQQFLSKTAEGSTHEFEVAQLGTEKAASSVTEQYALRLLNDHAKFNTQLMQLARRKGVTLPVSANPQEKATIDRLMGLSGATFDRAFAAEMVRINSEDIAAAQRQLNQTQDPDVKTFINQFLPGDQAHLQAAKAIAGSTAQNSPR